MREVEKFFNKIDGVPMWIKNWCKFLNKVVFKHYKPREETASASVSKRTRSIHSTNLWKKNEGGKGDSKQKLTEPKTFKRNLSYSRGDRFGPDSANLKAQNADIKLNERATTPVFSWIREQLNTKNSQSNNKNNNLIKIISNIDFLITCYNMIKGIKEMKGIGIIGIKGKPDTVTKGSTIETIDCRDRAYFSRLREDIIKGRFNFTTKKDSYLDLNLDYDYPLSKPIMWGSTREQSLVLHCHNKKSRIKISKDKSKTVERDLSLANPRDNLVKKALKQTLKQALTNAYTTPPTPQLQPRYRTGAAYPWRAAERGGDREGGAVSLALALVLETIYEPIFTNNSHGFRQNRPNKNKGIKSALKVLKFKGGTYTWVIKGDLELSKCFYKIPHVKIMKFISKQISCKRTLELITKSLKIPAIMGETFTTNKQGRPQGTLLSAIISNIVLHEFDLYCNKLKERFSIGIGTGTNIKVNPKDHSLSNRRHNSKYPILSVEHLNQKQQILRNIPAKDFIETLFRQLLYVRYADDFVVLLLSSLTEAFTVKRKIGDFLKNHLGFDLKLSKTTITNVKDGFQFLGAHIKNQNQYQYQNQNQKQYNNNYNNQNKKQKQRGIIKLNHKQLKTVRRVSNGLIYWSSRTHVSRLSVVPLRVNPLDKMIQKMLNLGFARRNHLGTLFAKSRRDLVNLTHYDIIYFYNARIRETFFVYSFKGNFYNFSQIWWIYAKSCAITLALKYKLKTMRKSFSKFGKNLKDPNSGTGLELYNENCMKVRQEYKNETKPNVLD
jgi:retron-type reverse transcriptase